MAAVTLLDPDVVEAPAEPGDDLHHIVCCRKAHEGVRPLLAFCGMDMSNHCEMLPPDLAHVCAMCADVALGLGLRCPDGWTCGGGVND